MTFGGFEGGGFLLGPGRGLGDRASASCKGSCEPAVTLCNKEEKLLFVCFAELVFLANSMGKVNCWRTGKQEGRCSASCSPVTFPLLLSSLTSAKLRALLQRYRTSENRPRRRKLHVYLQLHSPQGLQSWVCSPFKEMQSVMIIENVWPNASSFYLLFHVWARPISTEPFLACACINYKVFVGSLVINLWRMPKVKKKSNFFSDLLTCVLVSYFSATLLAVAACCFAI